MKRPVTRPPSDRIVIRLLDDARVQIGCSVCGTTDDVATESTPDMLDTVQVFIEKHASCVQS